VECEPSSGRFQMGRVGIFQSENRGEALVKRALFVLGITGAGRRSCPGWSNCSAPTWGPRRPSPGKTMSGVFGSTPTSLPSMKAFWRRWVPHGTIPLLCRRTGGNPRRSALTGTACGEFCAGTSSSRIYGPSRTHASAACSRFGGSLSPKTGSNRVFIFCVRHPAEVAGSLGRRNGMDPAGVRTSVVLPHGGGAAPYPGPAPGFRPL